MSTSKTYQQSLADAERKRDNRKWLLKALDEGPYEFKNFVPEGSTIPRLQTAEDLEGDDLLLHDAEMEVMNMILLSIPNEIYNSVDACTSAKDMWKRVERLMRGTIQNKVDRETRFTNEFDQFVAEPGEALVSVYNRFAQLMNDLERNNMNFPTVTINTKFLNSLQPEWLKYVTQVRLAKQLTVDSFDDLFDYLQQFEKLVNASRAKKLEKSHDPLSSSKKDSLVSAMLLHAKAITQNFSNPTNNHLRASSNTRNQAIIQGDRVNIQSRNSGNTGRNNRRAYVQEEVVEGMNAPNETGNVQRTLRTPSSGNTSTDEAGVILTDEKNDFLFVDASRMEEIEELSVNICLMARIQPADHTSDDGPSCESAFISEVQSSSINENNEQINAITPQQNGVAERKNRTLIEAARTMLADSFLPNTFWAEAVSTACYVLNRVLVTKPHNKTPYELLTGKKPIISYIRPFGCHVTILNTIDHLGKFAGKSDEGFLVGYSLQSKAFRVYNLETKRVEENLHINFLENKPNIAGKGPTWLFDLDYLTDSMNYHPVRSENQANHLAGQQEANQNAGTEDIIDAGDSETEDESAQDCFMKREEVQERKNKSLWMNLKGLRDKEKVANEELILRKKFETLVIQEGAAKPSSTNIFSTVSTPAKASSTNLVNTVSIPVSTARSHEGLSPSDPTNPEEDDSEIPPLEDIYQNSTDGIFTTSSYDDEGAVADFTNLETVVNVSPIPTSRIHSTHPKALILGDPNSAVQTRSKLHKSSGAHAFVSYVQKQRRNNHKDFQHCLFACFLSQHEPKKISEALEDESWVDAMQEEFAFLYGKIDEKNGYRRGTIDKTLFLKKDKHDIILVQVYVDDIIFGSTKKSWCDEFEALMKSRFQMSSMGELTFFLGLQVKQKEDGIFISQDKYVAEILKKFDFAHVKTASTPIETQKPLVKDEEASDVDVHLYRSMIGSLMYLTASRPDIMFAVCACSRFQVTPKSSHLSAVKRIFRYLKGKPKLGLWYPRVSSFDLESYSDSDYAGANLDRKSTTGGCQFLGRRLISWQCKKQTIVATSTTEAEYVAAASCCGQVLWIQNQMLDYGFNFMNTKIYIDNESTICIVKNPVYHSKTNYIAIRHPFHKRCYEKKTHSVLNPH
ncbi:putative ribonuclease H-like domain-containing protein [Tanacetum coccineum]